MRSGESVARSMRAYILPRSFEESSRPGAPAATVMGLELALGPGVSAVAKYFDRCRRQRNDLTYGRAGIVSAFETQESLREATRLRDRVEAWISEHHAELAKS